MRLELIWISPLPPQDSASTNFATTAAEYQIVDLKKKSGAVDET